MPRAKRSKRKEIESHFTFESIGYDLDKAREKVMNIGIRCKECKQPINWSQNANLDLVVASLDHLVKLGYQNPLQ